VKDVLLVPDFKFNMLSVSKATKQLSCFVSFYPDFCVFQDLHSGKVKGIGKEKGGLYIFKGTHGMKETSKAQKQQSLIAGVVVRDINLWHKRLGHPSSQVLKSVVFLKQNKDIDSLSTCHVCPLAKQARLLFPDSKNRAAVCFNLIYVDLWGPYKTPTLDQKQYFLTVVDDCSRYTWVHLLQLKSETIVALKNFFLMINT